MVDGHLGKSLDNILQLMRQKYSYKKGLFCGSISDLFSKKKKKKKFKFYYHKMIK